MQITVQDENYNKMYGNITGKKEVKEKKPYKPKQKDIFQNKKNNTKKITS